MHSQVIYRDDPGGLSIVHAQSRCMPIGVTRRRVVIPPHTDRDSSTCPVAHWSPTIPYLATAIAVLHACTCVYSIAKSKYHGCFSYAGAPHQLGVLPDLPQLLDHLPISSVTTVGTSSLLSHGQGSSESAPLGLYSSSLVTQATSASTQCTLTASGDFQRPISSSRSLGVPLAQERPAPLADDSTPSLVAVHSSLPLLSKQIVQQIQAGEFVDLADLPPARSRQSSSIPPMSALSTMGVLQLQEMEHHQKLLPDFLTWSQCFAVYTAVLGSCKPQRISELISYQYEIAKCARKFKWPSWVIYNINFWQEAASYPTL